MAVAAATLWPISMWIISDERTLSIRLSRSPVAAKDAEARQPERFGSVIDGQKRSHRTGLMMDRESEVVDGLLR